MDEFQRILGEVARIAEEYPGHVFIGGVAVYLHATNDPRSRDFAEASHDADFMLSLADFADLRDSDEVTANRRLSKHQLFRRGVEFDVYVERQNRLVVPYDEAAAHAVAYGAIRVACLEHLLVLKLEALRDRIDSAKGDKDARDLVTIARVAAGRIRPEVAAPFLRGEHFRILERVAASPVFTYITRGNAHEAKALRGTFSDLVSRVGGAGGGPARAGGAAVPGRRGRRR
jgi:hypothetical protein